MVGRGDRVATVTDQSSGPTEAQVQPRRFRGQVGRMNIGLRAPKYVEAVDDSITY